MKKDSGSGLYKVIIIAALLLAIVIGAASFLLTPPVPEIGGIPCGLEGEEYHIHAHLDIFINGQAYPVPAGVGIVPNRCLYWMHTHDPTGVIHVESPVERNFTLGEFFDIWGQPFNSSQIFTYQVGPSPLQVYVNGEPTGDIRNIILKERDEIVIIYGQSPAEIPTSYEFPPGL